jgi:[protein-PII] uridylyltransferase
VIRLARRRGDGPVHPIDGELQAQVRARIDEVLALDPGANQRLTARVVAAPPAYLLVHASSVVVRQCEMLEPRPEPGEVRVVVTPASTLRRWHLDVATADRVGLLAAFTGVLHRAGIGVERAVVATWPDGGALQSFVLVADGMPDPDTLDRAFSDSLAVAPATRPIAGARVTFDHGASPLYTACRVHAPDEPGLLHAIAAAMIAAEVDIHAARVTTVDGIAVDHFDLSDRAGNKLDRAREDAIVAQLTPVRACC